MASSSSTSESPDFDQEMDEASELVEYKKAMSASITNISDYQLGNIQQGMKFEGDWPKIHSRSSHW